VIHFQAANGKMISGILGLLVALGIATGCSDRESNRVQGYVEGEFVYVASPLPGQVDKLYVQRGDRVKAGEPLFALDSTPERAARDEAERRLAQGRSNLEDAQKGRRPTEIESLEAQLKQARAALVLADLEFERQQKLAQSGSVAVQDFDRARSARDQGRERVAQLEADLQTARLGSREDQIAAAQANVRALEAALALANWNLAQKRQDAPQSGLVFDTLYREGDWVAAGKPVVVLLPPRNIKVRSFVPETWVGRIRQGQGVRITVDGVREPFLGKVSFISPQAEFTPPVIYSRESRSKLVFMIEIRFDPTVAANLHPGQPVDVEFDSPSAAVK
jgi:HlyD family secretion protein